MYHQHGEQQQHLHITEVLKHQVFHHKLMEQVLKRLTYQDQHKQMQEQIIHQQQVVQV